MEIFSGFIILIIICFIYFAPAIIANMRNHRQIGPIAVLNLFLGWTLLGWVIPLAWSLSSNVEEIQDEN